MIWTPRETGARGRLAWSPGHGLSDPLSFQRGRVREQARRLVDDVIAALGLDEVATSGHSLGAMFALWHMAAGSGRISRLVAIGAPAVALPDTRVRMPLSLLTVRGLGLAVLRAVERIPGATLHEVPGGHAPWLLDAERAAQLITTHFDLNLAGSQQAPGDHPPVGR